MYSSPFTINQTERGPEINLTLFVPMCSIILMKYNCFSQTHLFLFVIYTHTHTFKATCFGSIQPSSGLALRTDPYYFSVHLGSQVLT